MRSKQAPDWAITVLWFLAGICATGSFWYFLGAANRIGTLGSAGGTIIFAVCAVVLHIRNDKLRRMPSRPNVAVRLLSLVWSYPLSGENEASWAVKESAAVVGNLGGARENPALGVAIVTTELARSAFGEAADSRLDRCISWAVARAERCPPYRMLVEFIEPINYEVESVKTDLRHTIAFGVILARAKRQYSYLETYLNLVLNQQQVDGGWPSGSGKTISPVFTAIYAVELLHLAVSDHVIPKETRDSIPEARRRGIEWLMAQREYDGLWSTGALRSFAWDHVLGTAWVLHRLADTALLPITGWHRCLDDAVFAMVEAAIAKDLWAGSSEAQRYRVEGRVAAAARRALRIEHLSIRSSESARLFTSAWRSRAEEWAGRQSLEEIDVGTAAFFVYGLVSEESLLDLGRSVLSVETAQ